MTAKDEDGGKPEQVEGLLATPDLASALESEQFRHFLDQIPIAIIVAKMATPERVVYANPEFERVTGRAAAELAQRPWSVLSGRGESDGQPRELGAAIVEAADFVGTFKIERSGQDPAVVDAYSNVIQDDDGTPCYRLAALVDVGVHGQEREELERALREKDTLLMEVQHRVKNNLQMITALMRIEARNARGRMDSAPFDRLAGRIESIQHLYALLADPGATDEIDLGVYLGKIATSVFASHAVEGVRLDLKLDAYPVSVNVAMPTGLVVNELLTNALKHAFTGRDGGTITLNSLSDGEGCRILVGDDGVGLPAGAVWPAPGRLGALIVQSLRENAKAKLGVQSSPGQGTRVTILFTRSASAPELTGRRGEPA
jgi:two-component sensor histidine kinase